jgi:hypothetical protein
MFQIQLAGKKKHLLSFLMKGIKKIIDLDVQENRKINSLWKLNAEKVLISLAKWKVTSSGRRQRAILSSCQLMEWKKSV